MNIINGFKMNGTFPAFLSPDKPSINIEETYELLANARESLHQRLLKHGALVFRGFPIKDAMHFATFIEHLQLGQFVNYIGGDSPRDKVKDKVYTSTEAPPSLHIPLHQELSFIKNHPRHIYFFCETPSPIGGATIIGDARRIFNALSTEIKQEFQTKQLRYLSRYYFKSPIMALLNRIQRSHKSWTEVFETDNKNEVQIRCDANDFAWRWLKRDWLEIKQTRPAIINHPLTHEPVWFNQAHLYDFNPKLLGWKNYIGATLFYARSDTRLHEIHYADGSTIPRRKLYEVMDVLNENTVAFPWQQGDVMVLDNVLTMHGRAPFSGKRRILTALTT